MKTGPDAAGFLLRGGGGCVHKGSCVLLEEEDVHNPNKVESRSLHYSPCWLASIVLFCKHIVKSQA